MQLQYLISFIQHLKIKVLKIHIYVGHCWKRKDKLLSDVLLWTPSHGWAKAEQPAQTYIQQLCADTRCSPEDLPKLMDDREGWRKMVMDIRANGATLWWWNIFPKFLIIIFRIIFIKQPYANRGIAKPIKNHLSLFLYIYIIIHIYIYINIYIERDLLKLMDDKEGWRKRVRDICTDGAIWWWWNIFPKFLLIIFRIIFIKQPYANRGIAKPIKNHFSLFLYIHINIYIYRERERLKETVLYANKQDVLTIVTLKCNLYMKGFLTIVFIFIFISTMFRPIYPPAFFRHLSNSGTFTELWTSSFIESTGVTCSDSVSHDRVLVLSFPVLLLACSQDWMFNLQMIVSLEA